MKPRGCQVYSPTINKQMLLLFIFTKKCMAGLDFVMMCMDNIHCIILQTDSKKVGTLYKL